LVDRGEGIATIGWLKVHDLGKWYLQVKMAQGKVRWRSYFKLTDAKENLVNLSNAKVLQIFL
jgi:hypothetical protein